jgi:hypothetical protein
MRVLVARGRRAFFSVIPTFLSLLALRGVAATGPSGELASLAALAKITAASLPPLPDAANRLAAMVLFTSGLDDAEGLGRLRCALSLLQDNVGSSTALDTYVWLLGNESRAAPTWLLRAPSTFVLQVPPEAWRLPAGLRPEEEWVLPGTAEGYRLMGMWRLGFAFEFARARCVIPPCVYFMRGSLNSACINVPGGTSTCCRSTMTPSCEAECHGISSHSCATAAI